MRTVEIEVSGPGSGRESALRPSDMAALSIRSVAPSPSVSALHGLVPAMNSSRSVSPSSSESESRWLGTESVTSQLSPALPQVSVRAMVSYRGYARRASSASVYPSLSESSSRKSGVPSLSLSCDGAPSTESERPS